MIQHPALTGIDPAVPVTVTTDRTLRVKVIDACGMTCTFCHNEGTPVSADNRPQQVGSFVPTGPSGRVSIYAATNNARFLSAPVLPDEAFRQALAQLREALGFNEVHLTGGEPTLHPRLPQLIATAKESGYEVSVTSNGENGKRVLTDCARAGLGRVNFSIFGTTPEELAQVQHARYRKPGLAQRKIDALDESIHLAVNVGIGARANVVLPNRSHIPRVHHLLNKYTDRLSVRVLSSLADGDESLQAIDLLLDDLKAELEEVRLIAGTSGFRMSYRLPSGRELIVKHIRPLRLPDTCSNCRFNNPTDCEEGYYGVRLYRDTTGVFHVGVCIQRMDLCLPVEEFAAGEACAEVARLRESDLRDLTA
ncbi:radical SAM protein [Streptomyces sp. NBC_01795]|uniref:radical SAM protein n=1 Tax=Streptomyces sp. NBC_01795 TaxID=2975943 RepID=UPI002DD915A3|nr:radical SAM protein [Streptomyces sp. NBC_01795]WSA93347.1 radical SAM protein [Streptomyces sp. NBC_01795]